MTLTRRHRKRKMDIASRDMFCSHGGRQISIQNLHFSAPRRAFKSLSHTQREREKESTVTPTARQVKRGGGCVSTSLLSVNQKRKKKQLGSTASLDDFYFCSRGHTAVRRTPYRFFSLLCLLMQCIIIKSLIYSFCNHIRTLLRSKRRRRSK